MTSHRAQACELVCLMVWNHKPGLFLTCVVCPQGSGGGELSLGVTRLMDPMIDEKENRVNPRGS